jgi:hypothetical protein
MVLRKALKEEPDEECREEIKYALGSEHDGEEEAFRHLPMS